MTSYPEPEPDLGPTKEELEQGFEPDDAIGRDGLTPIERAALPFIEPPEWVDELDLAAGYLYPVPEAEREIEAPEAEIA
jgi:hypothetical protein